MKFQFHPSLFFGLALAVGAPSLLTSCDTKDRHAALIAQEEVDALQKAKSKLETEVKKLRDEGDKGHADLIKRNEELQKEADEAKAQFEKLQDEAAKARKELEEYMAKYKLSYRAQLKGQSLSSLQTADDQSYQSVVLREVSATEVSFAHSNGVTRVPMDKLTPALQQKFLYDPGEVKRLEESKAAAAAAGADLEGLEGLEVQIVQQDPNRAVNPIVVYNLRTRILTRQKEIAKAKAEAARVARNGDTSTNLGRYRVLVLKQRMDRMKEEIKTLVSMLNKELNG